MDTTWATVVIGMGNFFPLIIKLKLYVRVVLLLYFYCSRFFCDCGASTTNPCKSLKPIKVKTHGGRGKEKEKKSTRTPHVLRMVEEEGIREGEKGGLVSQPAVASVLGVMSKESLVDTLIPVFTSLLQILEVSAAIH